MKKTETMTEVKTRANGDVYEYTKKVEDLNEQEIRFFNTYKRLSNWDCYEAIKFQVNGQGEICGAFGKGAYTPKKQEETFSVLDWCNLNYSDDAEVRKAMGEKLSKYQEKKDAEKEEALDKKLF